MKAAMFWKIFFSWLFHIQRFFMTSEYFRVGAGGSVAREGSMKDLKIQTLRFARRRVPNAFSRPEPSPSPSHFSRQSGVENFPQTETTKREENVYFVISCNTVIFPTVISPSRKDETIQEKERSEELKNLERIASWNQSRKTLIFFLGGCS